MTLDLRSRLFFSHILVMMVGLMSFIVISKASSNHLFTYHLDQLEGAGINLHSTRDSLINGFEIAWNGSTVWSLLVGAFAAAGLSYWISRRINQPLAQMERIARQFAAGYWQERVPTSDIPELAQLSNSFNRMATSLENIETRRRELMSEVTHELRTPLTLVRGYLEQFASYQLQPTPESYNLLVQETQRLERLVNDLQELSKAEAGHLPIYLQPLDVCALLKSLMRRFANQLLDNGPVLKLDCSIHLPPALADRDRTEQILVNLLGNAIRHTPQGSITLQAWRDGNQIWVAVTDTGTGIADDELPHVFERFWRSQCVSSTRGTGIGLAITKRLVELQGGRIEVESKLNQGTTFRFSLPI